MVHPSMRDRRKLRRRSLTYYMLVLDANTQQTIGHLIDITSVGLMMDSPKPFPLEKDFRLRLETNQDVDDKAHVLFTARSKWCLPDAVDPSLYDIGFSIISITPQDARIVQQIADKFASKDGFSFPAK